MAARLFVPRIDRWIFTIDRVTTDPETGWLVVDGTASRVGVLEYGKADGAPQDPWFELVPLSTLSNQTLLDSMVGLPITVGHPPELLTAANTKDYAKGTIVRAWMDGDLQRVRMSIWDADAIQGMRDGVRELSLGYHTQLDETPGTWQGKKYDAIQDARKANHLAIIDFARAGPDAKVDRFDSSPSSAWTARADSLRISRQCKDEMDEVEIEIAGVKHMVPAAVAEEMAANRAALEKKSTDDGDPPVTPPDASGEKDKGDEKDDEKDDDDEKDKGDEKDKAGTSGARGDTAPLTIAKLDSWGDKFTEGLMVKMDARRDAQTKAAEVRADMCTRASKVLPESYKTDGKSEEQIMFDGIVAVAPDLKALATEARSDAATLRGMFTTALAMNRSSESPGKLKFDTSGEERDPVNASKARQDQRRIDASKTTNVIGFEAARQRMDAEAKAQRGEK